MKELVCIEQSDVGAAVSRADIKASGIYPPYTTARSNGLLWCPDKKNIMLIIPLRGGGGSFIQVHGGALPPKKARHASHLVASLWDGAVTARLKYLPGSAILPT